MKVEVVVGPVPFGMKYYRTGEQFNVSSERFAKLLVKGGRVKEVMEVAPKRRRVYRRRDAKPEQAAVMTADDAK